MTLPLKPKRGGFVRLFTRGWFTREFLWGHRPFGSLIIDPSIGSPQTDIFSEYKQAQRRTSAMEKAIATETRRARKEKRPIDPDKITALYEFYLARTLYKGHGCYHSFLTFFNVLRKLGWVEPSGKVEPSAFQGNYPAGPPRIYYRLTEAGRQASDEDWANPQAVLYRARRP